MKTILKNVWIAGVLAASPLSQPVFGQVLAATPGSQPQAHPGLLLRASNDILNAKIFSSQGDEIGHIRDVLLNPKTGQLSHVVVGIGGWQGIGEELAIVPRQLVTQDEQHADTYILAADTEKFKSAPVFKQDQWATVVQPDYLAKIDRYYAGGPQVRQSSNASQPQQMTAKAPPAATAPKPPEEQPRKK
ncbi:MAG: PRC-barrel domain containing protein, partial [Verrucomicrobiaceae bacterium]